jgi:hypothetical protein
MSTVGRQLAALVAVLSLAVAGCGGVGAAATSSRRPVRAAARSRGR